MKKLSRDDVERDINEALNMIYDSELGYARMTLGLGDIVKENYDYLCTLEKLNMSYFSAFTNKSSIVTIDMSGDHTISAIDMGIRVIDVFNPNRLCRYAISLRLAAIKVLT